MQENLSGDPTVPPESQPTQNPNPRPLSQNAAPQSASFTVPNVGKIASQVGAIGSQVASIGSQVAAQGSQMASQIAGTVASGIEQAKGFVSESGKKAEPETNFVTMETEADRIRRKNLFYVSAFIGFVWMLFHFTVVYFFGIQLGSAVLVGIFLGFGNLVSLALDIPVAALQRYFSAKQLYAFSSLSMLAAGGIFLKFIYASELLATDADNGAVKLLETFVNSGANLFLLVAAAGLYGIAKEINDLTTLSYILNNADPSEYGSIVSKNNIFAGGGSLLGLVSSGFILAINPTVAVLVLVTFIVLLLAFIITFFDNSARTIDLATITKLKIIAKKPTPERLKEYAVGYLSKADFATASKNFRFVFLKPMSPREPFSMAKIIADAKAEARKIKCVIAEKPLNYAVLWAASVVLTFGFWDTFATSFLIEHLGKVAGDPKMAYVLLGVIAIPAFVTQDFFIRLSQKIGILPVVTAGIVASGLSMFGMA